jgi:DNA-binding transcriptional ArsR family regulator
LTVVVEVINVGWVNGAGTTDDFDLAAIFRALSDAGRRDMLTRLSISPATVSETVPPRMTLAAGLQHVQTLEKCGLITTERSGRKRVCRLNPAAFLAVEAWLAYTRNPVETRLDLLDEHLRK